MSSTNPATIDLRGSTKETESSYIGESSRESYTATLVLLIMFLFDSLRKEILFSPDTLTKFEAAHIKDNGKSDRRNLRKAAKEVIQKLDDLEEDESDSESEAEVEAITDGDLVNVIIPLSLSVYTNIQASVSFLFRECGVLQAAVLVAGMAKYVKGMKRRIRRMKQVLALKITEGKKVMTRDVYHFISRLFLESEEKEHIFARLFFSLDWYGDFIRHRIQLLARFITILIICILCLLIIGT